MKKKSFKNGSSGFTLVEILVSTAILAIAVTGILISFLKSMELAEVSRNSSLAIQAARGRMEQMRSTNFTDIKATYDQVTFGITDLAGIGVSYVDNTDPQFLKLTVTACWSQRSGRVYGEDKNLNGALNAGEDANGNGILDSPVMLVSYFFQRI